MITDRKEALREVKKVNPRYENIDPQLWEDKRFCISAIKSNGHAYSYVPEVLKNDMKILEVAVPKLWGGAAGYFSKELMADKNFVEFAVDISPMGARDIIENTSPEIQDDKDFCIKCITAVKSSFYYVSDRLKEDKDVCLAAASCWTYPKMPENMRADVDVFLKAVPYDLYHYNVMKASHYIPSDHHKDFFNSIPESIFEDKKAILGMVEKNVIGIHSMIPENMKQDKSFMLEAVKTYPEIIRDRDFVNDPDFMKAAIANNSKCAEYASEKVKEAISEVTPDKDKSVPEKKAPKKDRGLDR